MADGEHISVFKEAVEKEAGINGGDYLRLYHLPAHDETEEVLTTAILAKLTGKMKIRGVMAHKDDTPEYVNRMHQMSSRYWLERGAWRISSG